MASRLGPWLGRIAAADAKFIPALMARLRTGAGFVGSKVSDIVAWVKSNPSNAILVATTIASLGYSIAELFGDSKSHDAETAAFARSLDEVASKASKLIDGLGAKNEAARFNSNTPERQVQDEVAIETLSWARGFFGSVSTAVEAHRMLQAFIEMPLEEVRHGFSVYRLR